jgi:hypothetical protein
VKLSRLLPLLAMLALLFAPFGRMAAAETMAASGPHHRAAGGHCQDMPPPENPTSSRASIDCAVACAVVAPPSAPAVAAAPRPVQPQAVVRLAIFKGVNPEADPPPPRRS